MNNLIEVREKRLYVEIHGPENGLPLLYLHGGPGESFYEFMLHQSERLSTKVRLIAIDQRGVWRSDPIGEDESLSLQDLVDDCEGLREHLGIAQWDVLGHSFGGFLGLLYSTEHPQSVRRLIFEGPSFDFTLSFKSALRRTASLFEENGEMDRAIECLRVVEGNGTPDEILEDYLQLSHGLGDRRMRIYCPKEDANNYTEDRYTEGERMSFTVARSYI